MEIGGGRVVDELMRTFGTKTNPQQAGAGADGQQKPEGNLVGPTAGRKRQRMITWITIEMPTNIQFQI